jgi:hypothetical protein
LISAGWYADAGSNVVLDTVNGGMKTDAWVDSHKTIATITEDEIGVCLYGCYRSGLAGQFELLLNGVGQLFRITFSDGAVAVSDTDNNSIVSAVAVNNEWQRVEILMRLDGTNIEYRVRINDDSVVTVTAASTLVSADRFRIHNGNTGVTGILSYVIQAGTGLKSIGAYQIDLVIPESDDTVEYTPSTGTDNFALLGTHDDTTYNTGTAAQKDLFGMSNITVPAGMEIRAIDTKVRSRGVDTDSDKDFKPLVELGGTEYELGTIRLSEIFVEYEVISELSPATSNPWTETEVNSMISGYNFEVV